MDKQKLKDIVVFICSEINKFKNGSLKINKLLWFIESEYYRRHNCTITGVNFAAINMGPVIDGYKELFQEFENEGYIATQKAADSDRILYSANEDSTMDSLTEEQKRIVEHIIQGLGHLTETTLKELSHRDAYEITLAENNHRYGSIIDMELTLLENSPIDDLSSPEEHIDIEKIQDIINREGL